MFITLAAPLGLSRARRPQQGRAGRLLLLPGPNCPGDRTLRAVWCRRPLGKLILRACRNGRRESRKRGCQTSRSPSKASARPVAKPSPSGRSLSRSPCVRRRGCSAAPADLVFEGLRSVLIDNVLRTDLMLSGLAVDPLDCKRENRISGFDTLIFIIWQYWHPGP
jgi:hypothetical protein